MHHQCAIRVTHASSVRHQGDACTVGVMHASSVRAETAQEKSRFSTTPWSRSLHTYTHFLHTYCVVVTLHHTLVDSFDIVAEMEMVDEAPIRRRSSGGVRNTPSMLPITCHGHPRGNRCRCARRERGQHTMELGGLCGQHTVPVITPRSTHNGPRGQHTTDLGVNTQRT